MTGRAEKKGSIGLTERLVLHVNGKGISGLVLEGEMDVVFYAVAFLIGRFNLSDSLLKQSLVLRGDSDGKVAGAVCVTHVFLGFHKVLCDCGANFLRIAVELEDALGLTAVGKAFFLEKGPQGLEPVFLCIGRLSEELRGIEGEILDFGSQLVAGGI